MQMLLVQIKNIFVERNILSLIFLFRYQFFLCYKTFDWNTGRNELNLQKQTEHVRKIWKVPCSLKKVVVKGKQGGEYKKRKFENIVRRSDRYIN